MTPPTVHLADLQDKFLQGIQLQTGSQVDMEATIGGTHLHPIPVTSTVLPPRDGGLVSGLVRYLVDWLTVSSSTIVVKITLEVGKVDDYGIGNAQLRQTDKPVLHPDGELQVGPPPMIEGKGRPISEG